LLIIKNYFKKTQNIYNNEGRGNAAKNVIGNTNEEKY